VTGIQVLFVCTANICRSAFAEALSRNLLGEQDEVTVTSAGIHGFVDRPMDLPMAVEVASRGGDAGYFRSRKLTFDMVDKADLVLTAEVAHRSYILDDRPAVFRRMFTFGQFARMLPDLSDDARGRDLLEAAKSGLKPADPVDDIADPFGRGPEAASETAAHIERVLLSVIPRLLSK
jgi:sulfate adenylyltransferase